MQIEFARGFKPGRVEHPPLAFKSQRPPDHLQRVIVRSAGGRERVLFKDEGGSSNCPLAWSPDGSKVYHSFENDILAINVESLEAQPVWTGGRVVWYLDCCRETGRLSFNKFEPPNSSLVVLDPATGGSRAVYSGPFYGMQGSWASGRVVGWQAGNLCAIEIETGKFGLLAERTGPHVAISDDGRVAFATDEGHLLIAPRVAIEVDGYCHCLSWAPSGRILTFVVEDFEVWMVRRPRGRPRRLCWVPEVQVRGMSERRGSYGMPAVWSSGSRFALCHLTDTRRATKPPAVPSDEELMERVKAWQASGLVDVTLESLKAGYRQQDYEYTHAAVLLDLQERCYEICEGHWTNASFRPF